MLQCNRGREFHYPHLTPHSHKTTARFLLSTFLFFFFYYHNYNYLWFQNDTLMNVFTWLLLFHCLGCQPFTVSHCQLPALVPHRGRRGIQESREKKEKLYVFSPAMTFTVLWFEGVIYSNLLLLPLQGQPGAEGESGMKGQKVSHIHVCFCASCCLLFVLSKRVTRNWNRGEEFIYIYTKQPFGPNLSMASFKLKIQGLGG